MSQPTLESLEQRLAALEREVAQRLHPHQQTGSFKNWRLAVGQYPTTELSQQIDAAGRDIRETDRRQTEP